MTPEEIALARELLELPGCPPLYDWECVTFDKRTNGPATPLGDPGYAPAFTDANGGRMFGMAARAGWRVEVTDNGPDIFAEAWGLPEALGAFGTNLAEALARLFIAAGRWPGTEAP